MQCTHTQTHTNIQIHRVQQVEVKRRRVLHSSKRANYRIFVRIWVFNLTFTIDNWYFFDFLTKQGVKHAHCLRQMTNVCLNIDTLTYDPRFFGLVFVRWWYLKWIRPSSGSKRSRIMDTSHLNIRPLIDNCYEIKGELAYLNIYIHL